MLRPTCYRARLPAHMTRVALSGQIAIALHGGAGTIRRADMTPELDCQYRQALAEALQKGYAVLQAGGTALDAVEAAILVLEDCRCSTRGVVRPLRARAWRRWTRA